MARKRKCVSRSVVSDSFRPRGLGFTRPLCPWNFPGKNTGVGSCSLLQGIFPTQGSNPGQGIFPTQGSNPGLPHCTWILYQLSRKGNSRILEWVAYPFFRGSKSCGSDGRRKMRLRPGRIGEGGGMMVEVSVTRHLTLHRTSRWKMNKFS